MRETISYNVIVCPFKSDEREEVKKLILDVQEEAFGEADNLTELDDLNNIPTHYQNHHSGGFWVAKVEDKIVGVIGLKVNEVEGKSIATLKRFYVLKGYRGNKAYEIASKLFSTLLQQANSNKIKNIYLGTTLDYPAAPIFFRKNGFIAIDKAEMPKGSIISDYDTHFFARPL